MAERTLNGPTIPRQDIHTLAARLSGELITPDHADYATRRAVWNGMVDRRPALIARCATVESVQACVEFARVHNLPLAVRGGSHSVAGHATIEGGLVVDLSPMKSISVDPEARTARAGAGATWGELDAATQAHGLATPGGVFSGTGIAGLTLGGGYGWLRSRFGLSCDNLTGADVVTADGRALRASASENSDLLWGLRGGGGNFGIVTSFEYRLHPLGPEVMFVFAFFDGSGERLQKGMRFFRDFSAEAPDEVSGLGYVGVFAPGVAHFPPEIQGRPFFAVGALYAGPIEEGRRALQPLLEFDRPLVDLSGVMPYVQAQRAFDEDYPDGLRYYWKSTNLTRLDDEAIEVIADHARRQPSPLSTTDLWPVGGAVRRGSPDESAFFGREAAFLLNPEANWVDPRDDAANIEWAREFVAAMRPYSDGSRYLNFAGFQEEGQAMMRDGFGPQYGRLVELKQKYDPTNLFRFNQNIRPPV